MEVGVVLQMYFQALLRWGLWNEIISDHGGQFQSTDAEYGEHLLTEYQCRWGQNDPRTAAEAQFVRNDLFNDRAELLANQMGQNMLRLFFRDGLQVRRQQLVHPRGTLAWHLWMDCVAALAFCIHIAIYITRGWPWECQPRL
jgi:hypothetical protein